MNILLIAGAGTSMKLGAPSFNNFNDKIKEYASDPEIMNNPIISKAFKRVIEIIDQYTESNIEELFSFVHLGNLIEEKPNKSDIEDIKTVIGKVIYESLKWNREDVTNTLTNHKRIIKTLSGFSDNFNILSLNWDVVFDLAWHEIGEPKTKLSYGFDLKKKSNLILKPHGSMNWGYCKECNAIITIGAKMPVYSNPLQKMYCDKDHIIDQKLIIPPFFAKLTEFNSSKKKSSELLLKYKNIWKNAYNVLKDADLIIAIGYSFPVTDVEFLSFFKKALYDSLSDKRKKDVIIVSPEAKRIKNRLSKEFNLATATEIKVTRDLINLGSENSLLNFYSYNAKFSDFSLYCERIISTYLRQ